MGIFKEFKEFAVKGNVVDLAVGVIIGGAFGKVVSSVVNDVILPPIGFVLQGIDFKNLRWVLRANPDGSPAVSLNYGNFLQTVLEFVIVATSVFLLVKGLNAVKRRRQKEEEKKPPVPPREEQLLEEIRDLLKEKKA